MITDTMIAQGDQLGAQMSTFASLFYLAKMNHQELVFAWELRNFRRGYQMIKVFDLPSIRLVRKSNRFQAWICEAYCKQFCDKDSWRKRNKRIYGSRICQIADRIFYGYVRYLYRDYKRMGGYRNGIHCDSRLLHLREDMNYDICDGFGTYQDWGGGV